MLKALAGFGMRRIDGPAWPSLRLISVVLGAIAEAGDKLFRRGALGYWPLFADTCTHGKLAQAALNKFDCVDAARATSIEDVGDQTCEGTGIWGKLAAMAPQAREPAIQVIEILSERADQHHLGLMPWMATPLFVARQGSKARPRLSATGASAPWHDLCASDTETQEIFGKIDPPERSANVFRRGYLAWEAAPQFNKHTFGRLPQRCSGTHAVTEPNGGDQPIM